METVLAQQNSAEAVDRRDWSDREDGNRLYESALFGIESRADPVPHLGCRFFRKRHRHDPHGIDAAFNQLEIHLDKLAGLAGSRARQDDRVLQLSSYFRTM